MSRRLVLPAALALVWVTAAISGCGAPTSGTREIDQGSIPYGLLNPSPPSTPPTPDPSPEPGEGAAQVYFVGEGDLLVPIPVALDSAGTANRVSEILTYLEEGPTEDAQQVFGTALGSDIELELAQIIGTTAYIDLVLADREPAADQIPLAIGQLVLTVTSVTTISQVGLLIDGETVDVPLPGGQLTPGPVTAAQYQELTRAALS